MAARLAHNQKVAGSSPAPATKKNTLAFWLGSFSFVPRQGPNLISRAATRFGVATALAEACFENKGAEEAKPTSCLFFCTENATKAHPKDSPAPATKKNTGSITRSTRRSSTRACERGSTSIYSVLLSSRMHTLSLFQWPEL